MPHFLNFLKGFTLFIFVSFFLLIIFSLALFNAKFITDFFGIFVWVNFVCIALYLCFLGVIQIKKINNTLKISKRTLVIVSVFTLLVLTGLNYLVFSPAVTQISSNVAEKEVKYWNLDIKYDNSNIKSKIAYKLFPADDGVQKKASPIVYLHGGPGGYAVGVDFVTNFYKQFTALGYNVYVYDQTGSGLSTRLENLDDYSYKLLQEELEQIRIQLKVDKLTLIGESWGGTLAATYSSNYPERVEKIVFINPGELDISKLPNLEVDTSKTGKDANADLKVTVQFLQPRVFLANQWFKDGPKAAKAILSDDEADAIFDSVADIKKFEVVCKAENAPKQSSKGFGFWSLIKTSDTLLTRNDNPIPKIQKTNIPVLFIKAECDFLSSKIIDQYKEAYTNFELTKIDGAGHVPYLEKKQDVTNSILKFLE